ncbi:MAG: UvrD-helicase domain-containing protein [Bacteroidia bacterium]|nr:UvrD-helicase domain-containing protein [Bacteroidia bacterium]
MIWVSLKATSLARRKGCPGYAPDWTKAICNSCPQNRYLLSMAHNFQPNLKIYKSSAGSGKTYTLVREYLSIVLRDPAAYKQVLAITFTKKAASEMKERILKALREIRDGENKGLIESFLADPDLKDADLAQRAARVLSSILHDYSNFAVSTIDSFTYRIVQSFARDLDLPSRFEVETDTRGLITRLTDLLLDSIGRDDYVTQVLIRFAESKMDDESGWNIENDLKKIAEMIFKEESQEPVQALHGIEEGRFLEFIAFLKQETENFPQKMKVLGEKAVNLISQSGLQIGDFYYGGSGPANAFYKLLHAGSPREFRDIFEKPRFQAALESGIWAKKGSPREGEINSLMQGALGQVLTEILQVNQAEFLTYSTACAAYRNIYSLGVLKQMEDLLEAWKAENNVLHISDFNRKIAEFVQEEPAEYIYWRLGDQFRHYLLDEFQDTSRKQWENLLPLLENVLAGSDEPSTLLLVGDSKQAIYRWRSGDIDLLEQDAPDLMGVKPSFLSTNYRSREAIVNFNNALFEGMKEVFAQNPYLGKIYEGFKQEVKPGNENGGWVQVEFIPKSGNSSEWKKEALDKTLELIPTLLEDGFEYADLAMLVRTGSEGSELANFLSEAGIPVISSDSLFLYKDARVNFLISLFTYLAAPYHKISRAEVLHAWLISLSETEYGSETETKLRELLTRPREEGDPLPDISELLPGGFSSIRHRLDQLPLYELTEELVRIFGLNDPPSAYLQAFLDTVQGFSEKREPDISAFLAFWAEKRDSFSLQVPEGENAIRILTVHKSKGLQFPVVIMPFGDWGATPKVNSQMWAEANGTFADFSDTFLLAFNNDLEASYFNPDYAEEITKSYLDNVNLLYVALTRPEERLYLFAPQPAKADPKKDIKSISDAILAAFQTRPVQKIFPNGQVEGHYELGVKQKFTRKKSDSKARFAEELPSGSWRQKLRISRNFEPFWDLKAEQHATQLPPDQLALEALRRLPSRDKLPAILDQMTEAGLLGGSQRPGLQTWLQEILQKKPLADWFDPGNPARLNPELMRPQGRTAKADRLVRKGAEVVAIAFRTDLAEVESAEKKLDFFCKTLEDMGYRNPGKEVFVLPPIPLF